MPAEIDMRKIIGSLLLVVSSWAQAATVALPDIYVTKVINTNNDSGTYTITINQPPLIGIQPWYLSAWGIINQGATSVDTDLTGWTGELFDDTMWDTGIIFETDVPFPATPIFRFATGAGGIGDFTSVFGPGYSQAAVFWVSDYFANPVEGLVATSSNFTWDGGTGNSTAFAVISNATSGEHLACNIGVGGTATLGCAPIVNPVPIPAAVWLFASGLLGLIGVARKTVQA